MIEELWIFGWRENFVNFETKYNMFNEADKAYAVWISQVNNEKITFNLNLNTTEYSSQC